MIFADHMMLCCCCDYHNCAIQVASLNAEWHAQVLTAIKQGLAKQCAVDTAVLSNLASHIKLTRTLPLPSDVATGAATTDNAAVTTVNVTKVRTGYHYYAL
jgi:hypothetical protein